MSASPIEPPYPADLEAKGWALDLDYEKIDQSDTWALATSRIEDGAVTPELRPWLLMTWLVAWKQSPIASFPQNDKLIAAKIGMPISQFAACKDVLLCGFELATDGRLYHKTLSALALKMAGKRVKDRDRVAAFRAKSRANSADVAACNVLHKHDQHVSSAPLPTTSTNKDQKKEKKPVGKKGLLTLSQWTELNPDPDYSAVYEYADKIGLPPDFLDVAFFEFEEKFADHEKRYKDWKQVLLNYLRGNWLKLWFRNDRGEWQLNTAGEQARAAMLASRGAP